MDSKLQREVKLLLIRYFSDYKIRENYHPEWLISSNLSRLELDFYIEEINIAFEVQGSQHYRYTPHFHRTYDEFVKRKQYDEEKRDLCFGKGIKLFEIACLLDLINIIDSFKIQDNKIKDRIEFTSRFALKKKTQSIPTHHQLLKIDDGYNYIYKMLTLYRNEEKHSPNIKTKEIRQFFYKLERYYSKGKKQIDFRFDKLNKEEIIMILDELSIYPSMKDIVNNLKKIHEIQ